MKTFQKIIYWLMLVTLIVAITGDLITKNYTTLTWKINTLVWFGAAWIADLRCNKLQKTIDEISDYVNSQFESEAKDSEN
jgi:hypothetical protein